MLGLFIVNYIPTKKFQMYYMFVEAYNKEEAQLIADSNVNVKEVLSVSKVLPKRAKKTSNAYSEEIISSFDTADRDRETQQV